MRVEEILVIKGNCQFVLSEFDIAKFLRDSAEVDEIWKRLSPRRDDPGFLPWYGEKLAERAKQYWESEISGQMAHDDPIDVVACPADAIKLRISEQSDQ